MHRESIQMSFTDTIVTRLCHMKRKLGDDGRETVLMMLNVQEIVTGSREIHTKVLKL